MKGMSELIHREHLRKDTQYLRERILEHLHFTLAKDKYTATKRDYFQALAYTIRDHLISQWIQTQQQYYDADVKRVYYLSLEFLIGQMLGNALTNLDLYDNCRKALHDLDIDIQQMIDIEMDAGLGNGGLGRLAACFLDSMATLGIPGYGCGIRYDYGIFTQRIKNGAQFETPDNWLRYGNPWEICRPEYLYHINFYGNVLQYKDEKGRLRNEWVNAKEVLAMAYDTPIPGYRNETVNTLRLWQAKSVRDFDLSYFNHGDYIRAVEEAALSENISKVLYPNDNVFEGKELRLKQEYFLISATIQDIVRRYNKGHVSLDGFADKVAIQLNDTHPALAIAELMRIFVDLEEMGWEKAWEIAQKTFSYTNHTILPEALERWSVSLVERVLPRHIQIIYEINQRWLNEVHRRYPGEPDRLRRLSLIEEGNDKRVNMAHLAIVGSHKVNGVSALHSDLLKSQVFKEFYEFNPEKFTNKTNGITPRRWLKESNPHLSQLITQEIGDKWTTHLEELKRLLPLAEREDFRAAWAAVKRTNKEHLARVIYAEHEIVVHPEMLFDCQIKRFHEYKRQLLNIMHVILLYRKMRENPRGQWTPRAVIFSGKAAPGYYMAKQIIRLISAVADVVNHDPMVSDLLRVIFLENYRVSLAQKIIPGADLSEQISTAGTEASGTGNMKLALNGALTIGTWDGANIEMCEEVGKEHFFIFGLKAEEVQSLKARGYNPWEYYHDQAELRMVLDMIRDGYFNTHEPHLFKPIYDSILHLGDPYCICADFASYVACQGRVDEAFRDREGWTRKSIYNVGSMGKFSSDRTIREYGSEIWKL